jgi:hypothetical protein
MIMWLTVCIALVLLTSSLVLLPLMRHPTLPRRKKWLFCSVIFFVIVPGGLLLYSWVGMPMMAML